MIAAKPRPRKPARATTRGRASAGAFGATGIPADEGAPILAAAEIDALTGDPNFMTSLARGLAVIRAFSQQRRTQSIAQLSVKTGIPRAAVRRCLHTLAQLGYAGVDESRQYALRPKILSLGHAYLTSSPLVTSAQPLLDQVANALSESCSMAILEGDDILYVARSAASRRIMSIDLGIGSRLPAYCTSMGRVLLAGLPEAELGKYLARVRLIAYTVRTVTRKEALRRVLDETRTRGFALVDQELEIGLRSMAVPVRDPGGRVSAAINVGVQASRASAEDMERRMLPPLRAAAQELGLLLRA